MKTCTKCLVEKSLAGYPKNKSRADGHLSICKICTKESRKPRARKVYQCEYCQEFFQLDPFDRDHVGWNMRGKFCSKECYDACLGGISSDIPDRVCPICKKPTFNYFRCSDCLDGRVEIDSYLMMGG